MDLIPNWADADTIFLPGAGTSIYSAEELTERMGAGFELVHQTDYIFNPNGDPRPYVYA